MLHVFRVNKLDSSDADARLTSYTSTCTYSLCMYFQSTWETETELQQWTDFSMASFIGDSYETSKHHFKTERI